MPRTNESFPELDRLAERVPELAEAAAFYRAVLPVLRRSQPAVPALRLAPDLIETRLAAGRPLLVGEELPLNTEAARALFMKLARIVERLPSSSPPPPDVRAAPADPSARAREERPGQVSSQSVRAAAARQVRQAVKRGDLDLPLVWELLIAGDTARLESIANRLKLDAKLLRTLGRYSLQPAFQLWAQELQKTAVFDGWQRGVCPVCGSSPLLAEIQGKEGVRRLRCGLCGAGWRYAHLRCVFCDEQKRQKILAVEGEDTIYRLQGCDACHGYIKMVTTFDPIPAELLPVHDLATLHLDLIAADHGYTRNVIQLTE